MFPFAYSCDEFPVDGEMLMEASLGVAKAMRDTDGESYMTGQACGLTYRAPGDAIDFAYGATDVRWSFSAELRDTGLVSCSINLCTHPCPPTFVMSGSIGCGSGCITSRPNGK